MRKYEIPGRMWSMADAHYYLVLFLVLVIVLSLYCPSGRKSCFHFVSYHIYLVITNS